MDDWLVIGIIVAAAALIIGNFSTVEKSAKTPLRKKGLNDLEETLPRSNKSQHTLKNTRYNSPSGSNTKDDKSP
ncbi:hypothetical protein [Thalassotalea sp. PLHSN55]|uniref:hypothetical protein n=1 Tax=Thalassotalea sp. PLHSN55 TaxID=3435888 RepID=UPI003F876603